MKQDPGAHIEFIVASGTIESYWVGKNSHVPPNNAVFYDNWKSKRVLTQGRI
jgi:hypothetical protein